LKFHLLIHIFVLKTFLQGEKTAKELGCIGFQETSAVSSINIQLFERAVQAGLAKKRLLQRMYEPEKVTKKNFLAMIPKVGRSCFFQIIFFSQTPTLQNFLRARSVAGSKKQLSGKIFIGTVFLFTRIDDDNCWFCFLSASQTNERA
jgi:hypothetical protein